VTVTAAPHTSGAAEVAGNWAAAHRDELGALLRQHGSVAVVGLDVRSAADLAAVRRGLGRPPAFSREQFAPRRDFGDGIYSWPEWSAAREMCLHHEQSYGVDYPHLLLMACGTPPASGGSVFLGDTRNVAGYLPDRLWGRLREEGWIFLRSFLPRMGLPWQAALGTEDRDAVAGICARRDIGHEWAAGGILRLRQHRPAVRPHPVTGEDCFFNDVAFMSQWSILRAERDVLLSAFGPAGLPFNTSFGSGDPLTQDDYQALMTAYDRISVRMPWQPGRLLLVDNVAAAHGREAYSGSWDALVALAGGTP
jgi:Taurine catabolism dioxygenase TauD, TfdA family